MSIEIEPKVNLGHILIMIGMIGSGVSAYVAAKVTLNDHANTLAGHSQKLIEFERMIDKQGTRNQEMNDTLWGIKSDIAIIRQRVEMLKSGEMMQNKRQ